MPDVISLTEAEAVAALGELDVRDFEVFPRESLEPAGTVVDQVPSSGQRISGPVTLVVAEAVGPIPDFVGEQISVLEAWAEERKIEVRIEETLNDEVPDGEVLTTTPSASQQATSEILVTVARTPITQHLSELEPVDDSCVQDTGEASINGNLYPNSLFVLEDEACILGFNLGRDWERFKGTVGLTDSGDNEATYRFEVFGDGTSIFNQVVPFGETRDVDVDIRDVLRLELHVTKISGDRSYVAWGTARIIGSPEVVPAESTASPTS